MDTSTLVLLLVAFAPIFCRVLGALGGAAVEASSILLAALFEFVTAQEEREDEFDLQRQHLSNLHRQLGLAFSSPIELVRGVRETVESFNDVANNRERTGAWTRLSVGKRGRAARANLVTFGIQLAEYTEAAKNAQLAMIVANLQHTAELRETIEMLHEKLDCLMQTEGNSNTPTNTVDFDPSAGAGTAEA